jgi:tetratricopeptide (TPR) repeat protein/ADP-heptose:LPS heptosyltransferase
MDWRMTEARLTTIAISAKARLDAARALFAAGDHAAAAAAARALIDAAPRDGGAWKLYAVSLGMREGASADALAAARRAAELSPDDLEAHRNLAALQLRAGDREGAADSLTAASRMAPRHWLTHRQLGAVLRDLGRLDAAEASYRAALALAPEDAECHHGLGLVLQLRDQPVAAAACYRAAIRLAPQRPAPYRNLGAALEQLGETAEAIAVLDQALALEPSAAGVHNIRGVALVSGGEPAAALECFARALDLAPGDPEARWNRSQALLVLGRLREAWPDYECRWQTLPLRQPRATARPRWTGEGAVAGRTVLLWGEQGFGDQIQLARYAPLVAARGARVRLEVSRALLRLMRGLEGVDALAPLEQGFADDEFDLHCPLASLPLAMGTDLADIPARIPYLAAPAPLVAHWSDWLGEADGRPRIGVAWSGSTGHRNDRNRSIALQRFAALLGDRAEWIGLQRELRDGDRAAKDALPQLRLPGDRLVDFADTAALATLCDLVVSVDTSIAHLAGALGRPVWILLPFSPDWRWLERRDDSPWYPTARLYRQERPGDWDGVLQRVAGDLEAWRAARGQAPPALPSLPSPAPRPAPAPAATEVPAGRVPQLLRDGRFEEALAALDARVAAVPGDGGAWGDRGVALLALSRHEAALESLTRAVALLPGSAEAHHNRAFALIRLGRPGEALACADEAVRLRPDWSTGHATRGLALRRAGRLAAARAAYLRAVACDPSDGRARNNLALATLAAGDFEQGWRLHEDRWLRPGAEPRRVSGRPQWGGEEPLQGRTLLLTGEQGFGDQIQFVRYASRCAGLGARVMLEVATPLARLFAEVAGVAGVLASPARLADDRFDLHCPLMSLPLAFATSLATIPAQVPYLHVPAVAQAAWSGALATGPRPLIGIAWSGNPAHSADRERSLALSLLAPLLDDRAAWVSLQREVRPADRATLAGLPRLVHFGDRLTDFADTAALAARCDLVIAIDSAAAHLAGALGRPVWILLPFAADWRWLSERTDSPWYPTARLYRQTRPGDWQGVLAQVARDLAQWLAARGVPPAAAAAPPRGEALLAAYRSGDLARAESEAAALLAVEPRAPLALKMQGVLLARRGAFAAARAALAQAVEVVPTDAEAWRHLANVARRQDDKAAAEAAYRRSLDLDPADVAALTGLGRILQGAGQLEEAAARLGEAVRLAPGAADARTDLAVVLAALDRLDEAEAMLRAAIAAQPGHVHAHVNLAALLLRRGRLEAAIEMQARAAALSPGAAEPHAAHGRLLLQAGRDGAALAAFDRAIALEPGDAAVHADRGHALQRLGREDEALAAFDRAIALRPDLVAAHAERGLLLRALGRGAEAATVLGEVLARDPGSAPAHSNLALALRDLGRVDEALALCDQAIALAPSNNLPRWNKALILLSQGRYREAWPLYERRWRDGPAGDPSSDGDDGFALIWQRYDGDPQRRTARPSWRGQTSLQGRTILLWREQGFGDQIQFVRYAEAVAARGGRVKLEVDRPLLRLMDGVAGVAEIAPSDTPFPDTAFDVQCPLLSLPLVFDTRVETIPARVPYLQVPQAAEARWRRDLGAARRPRIGLAWSGHPGHAEDRHRSLALARLAPLLDPRAEWISLQRDVRPADRAALGAPGGPRHFGAQLTDFADTAALCALCDLVVTVDTSVAHLAGAIGRPVWIMLPFLADWRWLTGRPDSPWYPTARLYRQPAPGDWDGVFARIGHDLDAWLQAQGAPPLPP